MYHLIGGEGDFDDFCKNKIWGFNLARLVSTIQRHMETVEKKKVCVLVSVDGAHNLDQKDGVYIDQLYSIYNEGDRMLWYLRSALRQVLVVLQNVLYNVRHVMCAVSSTVTISGSGVLLEEFKGTPAMTSLPEEIQNATKAPWKDSLRSPRSHPQSPRSPRRNPRSLGQHNPRSLRQNIRSLRQTPRSLGQNPRALQQKGLRKPLATA